MSTEEPQPRAAATLLRSLIVEEPQREVEGDFVVEPLSVHGLERARLMSIYVFVVLYAWIGTVVAIYLDPWVGVPNLLYAYYLDNLNFTLGHLSLHAKFIEWPEWAMDVLCHHSFIHHYRDIQVLYWGGTNSVIMVCEDDSPVLHVETGSRSICYGTRSGSAADVTTADFIVQLKLFPIIWKDVISQNLQSKMCKRFSNVQRR